jgi:hypothetical protein
MNLRLDQFFRKFEIRAVSIWMFAVLSSRGYRSCFKTSDQVMGKAQTDEKAGHIQYM